MLDSDLLQEFTTRFYGYGTFSASYWFVGMEEGGGEDEENIARRLKAWNDRGRKELEDLSDFHRSIGVDRFFSERPKLQKTWKMLMLVLFGIEGRDAGKNDLFHYQSRLLGRTTGNTCLLELLPLPSPGLRHWSYSRYADLSRFPFLETRQEYRRRFAECRADEIGRRVREHKPKLVVFYGLSYRKWWERIAGVAVSPDKLIVSSPTSFLLLGHPSKRGITEDYFRTSGSTVAAALPSLPNARHLS